MLLTLKRVHLEDEAGSINNERQDQRPNTIRKANKAK